MSEINDLETLASVWREGNPGLPADLQRTVRRQTYRMRLYAGTEVLLSVTLLGGSMWLAFTQSTAEFNVLAAGVWIITIVALIYSFANRAGTWNASAQDTRGYLGLSLRRCRSALAAIRFGLYLLAVEVVLLAAWHLWYWSKRPAPPLENWLVASCLPAGFLIVLLALRARRRRELARLEAAERELVA